MTQKNKNSLQFVKKNAKCHPDKNRFFSQNQKSNIECIKHIINDKVSQSNKFKNQRLIKEIKIQENKDDEQRSTIEITNPVQNEQINETSEQFSQEISEDEEIKQEEIKQEEQSNNLEQEVVGEIQQNEEQTDIQQNQQSQINAVDQPENEQNEESKEISQQQEQQELTQSEQLENDDDSLESMLKKLVHKSNRNQERQDSLQERMELIENYIDDQIYKKISKLNLENQILKQSNAEIQKQIKQYSFLDTNSNIQYYNELMKHGQGYQMNFENLKMNQLQNKNQLILGLKMENFLLLAILLMFFIQLMGLLFIYQSSKKSFQNFKNEIMKRDLHLTKSKSQNPKNQKDQFKKVRNTENKSIIEKMFFGQKKNNQLNKKDDELQCQKTSSSVNNSQDKKLRKISNSTDAKINEIILPKSNHENILRIYPSNKNRRKQKN